MLRWLRGTSESTRSRRPLRQGAAADSGRSCVKTPSVATSSVSRSWIPVPGPQGHPHIVGVTSGRNGCLKRCGSRFRARNRTTQRGHHKTRLRAIFSPESATSISQHASDGLPIPGAAMRRGEEVDHISITGFVERHEVPKGSIGHRKNSARS